MFLDAWDAEGLDFGADGEDEVVVGDGAGGDGAFDEGGVGDGDGFGVWVDGGGGGFDDGDDARFVAGHVASC